MAYEEEEEYRDEYRGHGIVCEGDLSRCSHVRARVRWETGYVGMSEIEYVSDVDLADVGESRSPVEDCRRESEKDGACLLTVKGKGKAVFLDGRLSGIISDDEGGARYMAGLVGEDMEDLSCRYDVRVGGRRIVLCHSKSAVDRYSSEQAGKPVEDYVASHPVTMNVMAIDSVVLDKPPSIEESCGAYGAYGFKGLYEPETETIYINPCHRVAALVGTRVGYGTVSSFAEEYARTVIHEVAHFMDDINAKQYRGGWEGETGLGALFGKPIPWGSEMSSEEKAREAMEDIKRMDGTAVSRVASKLESEIREYEEYYPDAKAAMGQAKEFLDEIERRGYGWFFGGTMEFDPFSEEGPVMFTVHLEKDDHILDPEESFRIMREIYEDMRREGRVDPDFFDVTMSRVGGFLAADMPFIVIKGVMPDPMDYAIPPTLEEY